MGFMDKAKKMAEQAQQKLDEVQEQFQGQRDGQQQAGKPARYDEHGRPIEEGPPAGEAPPPPAEPAPAGEQEEAPPGQKASPEGVPDASPDPFKPIE